ncbi:MAG: alpha/beta hydrolase [Candidatus Glassbacteria bacterium]|nr:alpha/beta hydrolase [Candidatus Glassbacteria bacterium]
MLLHKSILLALASVGAVLLVLALLVRLLENSLTFHPMSRLELTPDDYRLDYREIRLDTGEEGVSLHGWYFAPTDGDLPVLLVCHGNAGNISHRLEWLVPFLGRGWGAVLFDYRGFGLSTGRPSEQGLNRDAKCIYEFMAGELAIRPERIVLFGRSLGGAPVAWLAARFPVGSVVIEGSFSSGAGMARRLFGLLPLHFAARYRWPVAENLRKVKAPVMILHGTDDSVVPFSLGEKLAETVSGPPVVVFRRVEGGGHLNLHLVLGESYYDGIARFVRGGAEP